LQVIGENNVADFFTSDKKRLLFGMGFQAAFGYEMCKKLGIKLDGLICSDPKGSLNPDLPKDINRYSIVDFPYDKSEYVILATLNEKKYDEVKELLNINGFDNIVYANSWLKSNEVFKNSFIIHYLDAYQNIEEKNKNADTYYFKDCRIKKVSDRSYISMLTGEFWDIIGPSIYNEYRYTKEGEYENEYVRICKGDIVLDLGANIGLFSCVAASKGAVVYAFEPSPDNIDFLKQNVKLYENIYIAPYAATNRNGKSRFFMNDLSTDELDLGQNTLKESNGRSYLSTEIEVDTITIDDFVKVNNLTKVDFIKADIEGSERDMLKGAFKTLRNFSPKLSLCTYHLVDDPEVMEKLILEANPNYIVKHGRQKLYAYVPS
jgi:FkbM family methyltransferase